MLARSIIALLLVAVAALFNVAQAGENWTYKTTSAECEGTDEDPCGPAYWGKVYPTCGGERQSPIDISNAVQNNNLGVPQYVAKNGGCTSWSQFADEHAFKISFAGKCTNHALKYRGNEYTLNSVHFHSISEHSFGGGFYAAEGHAVHIDAKTGNIIVLGIMLDVAGAGSDILPASNNTLLNTFWNAAGPNFITEEHVDVTVASPLNLYRTYLPAKASHFRYQGSLTTPPCSEVVEWFVFEQPVKISQDDLRILRTASRASPNNNVAQNGNTNRSPQAKVGSRTVYYVSGDATTAAPVNSKLRGASE